MKKTLRALFVVFLPFLSFSDHLAGAELSYRHILGNIYLITFDLYRDCGGNSIGTSPFDIQIKSNGCGVDTALLLRKVLKEDLETICDDYKDRVLVQGTYYSEVHLGDQVYNQKIIKK